MIVLNSSLRLSIYAASFLGMGIANLACGYHHVQLPGLAMLTAELRPIQVAAERLDAISHGNTNFTRKKTVAQAQAFTATATEAVASPTPINPTLAEHPATVNRTGNRPTPIWTSARETLSAGTHTIAAAFNSLSEAFWAPRRTAI